MQVRWTRCDAFPIKVTERILKVFSRLKEIESINYGYYPYDNVIKVIQLIFTETALPNPANEYRDDINPTFLFELLDGEIEITLCGDGEIHDIGRSNDLESIVKYLLKGLVDWEICPITRKTDNTVYLSKSNNSLSCLNFCVRGTMNQLGLFVNEHVDKVYSEDKLLNSNAAVVITDGFNLGKGIFEEIVKLKQNKIPFIIVVPYILVNTKKKKIYIYEGESAKIQKNGGTDYIRWGVLVDANRKETLEIMDFHLNEFGALSAIMSNFMIQIFNLNQTISVPKDSERLTFSEEVGEIALRDIPTLPLPSLDKSCFTLLLFRRK